jgi:hypothetical protein
MPFPETEIQIRQLEHAQMLKRDSSVSAWLHLRSNLHTKEGVLWRAINGADVHGAGGSLFQASMLSNSPTLAAPFPPLETHMSHKAKSMSFSRTIPTIATL